MSQKTKTGRGPLPAKPRRPPRTSTRVAGVTSAPMNPAIPNGFTVGQYEFALAYLANGGNATRAYLLAHPGVTYGTACVEGHRTLSRPNVRAYIAKQRHSKWKALHMSGDEALMRVALDARADLRGLFNDKGKMLEPHLWPDDLANSIEAVSIKEDGTIAVKLASKAAARRIVLEQTGKLRSKLEDTMSALAKALRRDLGKDEEDDDE
jgi:phage terminase small subunit